MIRAYFGDKQLVCLQYYRHTIQACMTNREAAMKISLRQLKQNFLKSYVNKGLGFLRRAL